MAEKLSQILEITSGVSTDKEGQYFLYYPAEDNSDQGLKVNMTGPLINGKKEGVWTTFSPNGKELLYQSYKKDQLQGRTVRPIYDNDKIICYKTSYYWQGYDVGKTNFIKNSILHLEFSSLFGKNTDDIVNSGNNLIKATPKTALKHVVQ